MNQIEKDINEIDSKINNPKFKIIDHCDKLRNRIDVNTETLIKNLNSYREQLFNEINLYEQDCIKNFKNIEKKEYFVKIIKENADLLDSYYNYVNRSRIDEQSVKNMMNEAKLQEYKLKNLLKILDCNLFGKNLLNFEESSKIFDSGVIGKFNYENLEIVNDVLDVNKLSDLKPDKTIIAKADSAIEMHNSKYLVSNSQNLRIIDEKSNILVEIRFDNIPEFFAHNNVDSIFVQHNRNIWLNNRKEKCKNYTLGIYDLSLNLKNEITPDFQILACVTNNHNIFVQTNYTFCVYVYSWALEKITSFGQVYFMDRPYFFKDFKIKIVKNDKIYLKKINVDEEGDFWIKICSLNNGELLNEYYLNGNHDNFFIDSLQRTVVVDEVYSNIKIYEKPNCKSNQADLLFEKSLDLKNSSGLRVTPDGKLYFVKDKQVIQGYSFCT